VNGEVQRFAFVPGLVTRKDDAIRVITGTGTGTGTGGGLGDPRERDPALAARDVEAGLISAEHALQPGAAGQVSDCTGAAALLGSLPKAEWLLADRGHDADWFREALKDRGIKPVQG
jgi:hypothetical protein